MKQIISTLAVLTIAAASAFAQRHCDIEIVSALPAPNATINCKDSFKMNYLFINNGPDIVKTTDTLSVEDGENFWSYSIDEDVAVGDTVIFWPGPSHMNATNNLLDASNNIVDPPYADGNYKYPIIFLGFTDTTIVNDTSLSNNGVLIPITVNCSTGIGDVNLAKENLTLFPNPSNGIVNFSYTFTAKSNATIRISDISGRLILTKELGSQASGEKQFNIDLSMLKNGMYYLELFTDDKRAISKLTIQK